MRLKWMRGQWVSNTKVTPASWSNVNVISININGIKNKHAELNTILNRFNIHIALKQETKLSPTQQLPKFYDYTPIRKDKDPPSHSLLTLIHKDIRFSETTNTINT